MKSLKAGKKSILQANDEIAATESVLEKAVKAVEKKTSKKALKKVEASNQEDGLTSEKPSKSSTKKSTAKTSKKMIETKVVFQFLGNDIEPKSLLEQAKEDYLATGGKEKDIETMELYIKPEDNAAYYVVNGTPYGKVTIFA